MAQISNNLIFDYSANAVSFTETLLRVQQNVLSLGDAVTSATQNFSELAVEQRKAFTLLLDNNLRTLGLGTPASTATPQTALWSNTASNAGAYNSGLMSVAVNCLCGTTASGEKATGTEQNKKDDEKDKNKNKTWRDGLKASWGTYAKAATDMYTNIKTVGDQAFKQLDAGLASFVKTGKMNFESFTQSVLQNLAQVMLKATLVDSVNAAFGWFGISTMPTADDNKKDKAAELTTNNNANLTATGNDKQDDKKNQDKTWRDGLGESWGDYADSALNAYSLIQGGSTKAFDALDKGVSNFVKTGKMNFSDFSQSVLAMLAEIAIKSAILQGVNAAMGFFGVTANAKGGVYSSASLSAYSGQVVDRPTLFAFAKGAGLMGEAGPEAIMPLTRNANGVLGVKAVGAVGNSAPQVNIHIASDGRVSQTSNAGLSQFGNEIGTFVDQRFKSLLTKEMGQGRMLNTAMKGRRS